MPRRRAVLALIARLPLGLFHALGVLLGWFVWLASPRYRRMVAGNLATAGFADPVVRRASISHAGRGLLELLPVWFRDPARAAALVVPDGLEESVLPVIAHARAAGRGVIFVTPHLGCFEITAQWYAHRVGPMTVLFAPPKKGGLDALVRAGRAKARLKMATPDLRGMRALHRALRAGEAVGMLPDQVPGRGDGEWAPFFSRPAYTMTLVQRLAEATGAAVLLAWGERLPDAAGFRIHVVPMPEREPGESAARHTNRALESLVRQCPAQYLWGYNRYKVPAGAPAPGAGQGGS